MATQSVEDRLDALETKLERLRRDVDRIPPNSVSWWKQNWGWAKDDPLYEEAMHLGREYRESQAPPEDAIYTSKTGQYEELRQ